MLEKHLKCKDMSKQMRKKYANTEGNLYGHINVKQYNLSGKKNY